MKSKIDGSTSCISLTFRLAVNADKKQIIEILVNVYSELHNIAIDTKYFIFKGNHVVVYRNEDYDKTLSMIGEDKFLYYKSIMDFCPQKDSICLESQIELAKEIETLFVHHGIKADIIAEFEHLL